MNPARLSVYLEVPITGNAPGKERLTFRQEWIWLWMLDYQAKHKRSATCREIVEATGVASVQGISDQLKALIRKGFAVRHDANKARNVVAIDPTFVPTEKGLKAAR